MTDRVAIVGGGHNALACAAYLAKGGMSVTVFEAREFVGGMATTREFAPGYRAGDCAHFLYQMQPEIVRELSLARFGLRLAATNLATVALSGDGNHVRLHGSDIDGLITERDRRGMAQWHRRTTRFAAMLRPLLSDMPPRLVDGDLADKKALLGIGWALKRLGRRDMREFLRLIASNVYDALDETLDDPLAKGALATDAVLGTKLGPRSPNTMLTYLLRQCGQTNDTVGAVCVPNGGMGTVSDAFAAAAEHFGATLRTGAPVRRIVVDAGRTAGVELDDGELVPADVVVAGTDPVTTVMDLVGARHFDIGFVRRIRNLRADGTAARLLLALDGKPDVPGLVGKDLGQRLLLAGAMDDVERAFNPVKYGRFSAEPVLEISIPTALDASLAPPGHHVLSMTVQYVPHKVADGWNEAARNALYRTVMRRLDAVMPGVGDRVVGFELSTPADLARRYRVTGGHWHHGEMALDQFFFVRPVVGASRYAMPLPGLYLCGAGAHPGGGVMAAAGRNAARAILKAVAA